MKRQAIDESKAGMMMEDDNSPKQWNNRKTHRLGINYKYEPRFFLPKPFNPSMSPTYTKIKNGTFVDASQTFPSNLQDTTSSSADNSSRNNDVSRQVSAAKANVAQQTGTLAGVGEGLLHNNHNPFITTVSSMIGLVSNEVDASHIVRLFCGSSESNSIADFASGDGFINPRFTLNPHARKGNRVFDRFLNVINNICKGQNQNGLSENMVYAPVELVFHGTRMENIDNILENGLDPKLRRGQAYGKGEYFSRSPAVSSSYCRGGTRMLVFCVVVPENCRQPNHLESTDPQKTGLTNVNPPISRMQQMRGGIPASYVVVPVSEHQIPIGWLDFDGLSRSKLEESQLMRMRLKQLSDEVQKKESQEKEAKVKAEIEQLLIKGFIDSAGTKYKKNINSLSEMSKREISMFAHRGFDEGVVSFYFPDLPPPMTTEEHDNATVLNVNKTKQEASEAKKAYQDAVDTAKNKSLSGSHSFTQPQPNGWSRPVGLQQFLNGSAATSTAPYSATVSALPPFSTNLGNSTSKS